MSFFPLLFYGPSALFLPAPLANHFSRLAQYNPHGDGYVSEESDEYTYTIGIEPEDELSEAYFAMAA